MNGVRNEGTGRVGETGATGEPDLAPSPKPGGPPGAGGPNADGVDAGSDQAAGWEATRLLQATVSSGGTITIADLALYGAGVGGGTGPDLPADREALRARLQDALGRALPPGTSPEVEAKLRADLDALVDSAATAEPIRLPSGEVLTPAQALKGLERSFELAAKTLEQAPPGSVPPATLPPPRPEPAKVTTNPQLPPAQAPKPPPPQPPANQQVSSYGVPVRRGPHEEAIQAATRDDDAAARVSKDKRALAAMTPAEKARAIQELKDGWTKDPEDRAILDILLSCKTREEFDEVMRLAGGTDVLEELDHGDSRARMVLLFQMWGRTDLIPGNSRAWAASQVEEGILLRPDAGELEGLGSNPADVDPAYGRTGADMNSRQSSSLDRHLYREMDPGTRIQLIMENSQRKAAGKPPLDLNKLTAEARAINEDPSLNQDQKNAKLEQLRKDYGLSGDVMRELVTGRLSRALGEVKADLTSVYQDNLQMMMLELRRLGERTDEEQENDPPKVKELKNRIRELKSDAETRMGSLQAQSDALNDLYKVPAGFWGDLGDFIEKWGPVALKVLDMCAPLLNFIPGVGNALYLAYVVAKTAYAAYKGDAMGVLAGVASLAGPAGGALGGSVGSMVVKGGQLIKAGMAVQQGCDALSRKDYVGAIAGFGAGATGAGGALGASAKTLNAINDGVKVSTGLVVAGQGIADGDYEKALSGVMTASSGRIPCERLNKLFAENPWIKDTFEHTKNGVEFFRQVRNGDYAAALGTLDKEFSAWAAGSSSEATIKEGKRVPDSKLQAFLQEHPEIRDLPKHGKNGLQLYNQIKEGDYEGALNTLAQMPVGDRLKVVVDELKELGGAEVKAFLDEHPNIKAALKNRKEGMQLFNQLRDGDYAGAMATLKKVGPEVLGDEWKGFADKHPDIVNVARNSARAVEVYQQIRSGDYAGALANLQQLPGGDRMKEALEELKELGGEEVKKFLDEHPNIKAALKNRKEGLQLFNQLRDGDYTSALATLKKVAPEVLGDEWKAFADKHPDLADAAENGARGVQLYQQIQNRDYAGALATLQEMPGGDRLRQGIADAKKLSAESIEKYLADNPTLKRAISQREEGALLFNQLRNKDYDGAVATLQRVLPEVLPGSDIEKLMVDAKRRMESPEIQAIYRRFEQSAPFVASVATGDYAAALTRLLEVDELKPIHEEIRTARAKVREFAPFFREMVNQSLLELNRVQAPAERDRRAA